MSSGSAGSRANKTDGNSIVRTYNGEVIDVTTTESGARLNMNISIDKDSFSASTGEIRPDEDSTLFIINHFSCDRGSDFSPDPRIAAESYLHIDDTLVSGAYTFNFIRQAGDNDAATDCAYGIYEVAADESVKMKLLKLDDNAGQALRILGTSEVVFPPIGAPYQTALSAIKLTNTNPILILEATSADDVALTSDDADADMDFTTQVRKDTGYTHTSGNAEITIDNPGTYLVMYSNSWERAVDDGIRTGVYERFQLDNQGGGGFVDVAGSYANNYIRGSPAGESILIGNNSSATLIRTTVDDEVIKLVSAREAGAITIDRLSTRSRLCIWDVGDAKTFKLGDTTTQNIGSTTAADLSYDTQVWSDPSFTHGSSTDDITVDHNAKFLLLQGTHSDVAATVDRSGPIQFGRFNGSDFIYGTGSSYSRGTGGMQRASPQFGCIQSLTATQKMLTRTDSIGANATDLNKIAALSGMCGIDLSTF